MTEHVIECGIVREKLNIDQNTWNKGEIEDIKNITEVIMSYIEYQEKEE